jgi:hypothetical protein
MISGVSEVSDTKLMLDTIQLVGEYNGEKNKMDTVFNAAGTHDYDQAFFINHGCCDDKEAKATADAKIFEDAIAVALRNEQELLAGETNVAIPDDSPEKKRQSARLKRINTKKANKAQVASKLVRTNHSESANKKEIEKQQIADEKKNKKGNKKK